jgi:hypothetical protein
VNLDFGYLRAGPFEQFAAPLLYSLFDFPSPIPPFFRAEIIPWTSSLALPGIGAFNLQHVAC